MVLNFTRQCKLGFINAKRPTNDSGINLDGYFKFKDYNPCGDCHGNAKSLREDKIIMLNITIHKKGKPKLISNKLYQHRSRHQKRLLRLSPVEPKPILKLRLLSPYSKRSTIKKRGH